MKCRWVLLILSGVLAVAGASADTSAIHYDKKTWLYHRPEDLFAGKITFFVHRKTGQTVSAVRHTFQENTLPDVVRVGAVCKGLVRSEEIQSSKAPLHMARVDDGFCAVRHEKMKTIQTVVALQTLPVPHPLFILSTPLSGDKKKDQQTESSLRELARSLASVEKTNRSTHK